MGFLSSLILLAAVRRNRMALTFTLIAVCGFGGTLLSFALGNQPVNLEVAGWTAATIPADWMTYRDRWDAAHTLSAGLAALAFAALVVGSRLGAGRARVAS